MDDNSLNDIQSKIKQAKSKEELSKNWAAYMEELKKKAARASGPNSAPEALRSGAREANKANELTSPVSLTPMEAAREKIRKLETELSQTQKEKDDAGRQIKEISEKLRLQDSQISSQEEELRQRALEVQKVKEELNQKALDLAKNEEQIARLRQDFAARVMEIERLRQERDSFMEMEQGIRQKS
ncbi:MAG: hypothetical protein HY747_02755 [Elusimicrobia bacterium]|nr:hypothetical protein [Elusimicrobiota bacterium]